MTELHLTVTTREAFTGSCRHFTITDVGLQLGHGVEVTLTHVAPVQCREIVGRLWQRVTGVTWAGRVRCVDLFDVHL